MVSSLGAAAIAAIGLTGQPKFICLAVFLSVNVAVSAIVARRKGEGDREGANRVLVQAILLSLIHISDLYGRKAAQCSGAAVLYSARPEL